MKLTKKIIYPLLGLAALFMPSLGLAATCTVLNSGDTSVGSLRDCITQINASTDSSNTIDFDPGVTSPIVLITGTLTLDVNVTLQGLGQATTVIDGNNASRVFEINSAGNDNSVTISGVTLQNGNGDGSNGGCIVVDYFGSLLLVDSLVQNCKATGNGGGIDNRGNLAVSNSTVSGNQATSSGGGIYNGYTLSVANNSHVNGNFSEAGGGGIDNGETADIHDSEVANNHAHNGSGGGIYNCCTMRVDNTQVTGNATGIDISGNPTGSGTGGGIYNGELLAITNSNVSNNTATDGDGGGIDTEDSLTMILTQVNNNKTSGTSGGLGGGIYNDDYASVDQSTISGNSTSGGNSGGGIVNDCCEFIVTNSLISGNTSSDTGGGAYNNGDNLLLINVTFFDNTATNEGGAYDNESVSLLNNVTVYKNNSTNGNGGGIYNNSELAFSNSIFAGNSAGTGLGPDCFNDSSMTAAGANLIQDPTDCVIGGDDPLTGNPLLDTALADNGGPTQTVALLAGSQAINAGNNDTCEPTDQRGTVRPQGPDCDLGAFEAGPSADLSTLTLTFGEQQVGTTSAAQTVTLTNNGTIALTINSIESLLGSDFAQTNDCGASLAVGDSCTITITFGPTGALGVITGSITVDTSANIQLINLLGAAIAAAAAGGCGCNVGDTVPVNPMMVLGFAGLAFAGLALRRKAAK